MIDLTENTEQLEQAIKNAKERNIILPTFEQMKNPQLIPDKIKEGLKEVELWDIELRNLFRKKWLREIGMQIVRPVCQ